MRQIVYFQAGDYGKKIDPKPWRLSLMDMVSIELAHITEILIINLKELTFITTKPLVQDMFPEPTLIDLEPGTIKNDAIFTLVELIFYQMGYILVPKPF